MLEKYKYKEVLKLNSMLTAPKIYTVIFWHVQLCDKVGCSA